MNAIVIGGGIGGLAAAIALARAGIGVAVYERAPVLGEVGAGITLWPNATRVLLDLGVGDAVLARGRRFHETEIRSPSGKLLARSSFSAIERHFDAPCIALHRAELHRALADAVPASTLHTGAECTSVDAEGAEVALNDGRTVAGDVVIGADGIRSAVRAAILPQVQPRYAGYTAFRAIAGAGGVSMPIETWGRGARFGAVPLTGERVYWFATVNAKPGLLLAAGERQRLLLDTFGAWADPVARLIRTTPADAILHNDIFDIAPFTPWSRGRAVLLGDAAHPTTPNLGQGACMALESAAVLAAELSSGASVPEAIHRYERRRMRRTAAITNESWRLGRIGQTGNRLAAALRDLAVRVLPPGVGERRLFQLIARS
ncbi:MAG TPA: FAD-dependent monooxygenase [Thermoanaerobaculia bacterium]|nr:FAD-dependent monooxygenase [Thermoanaerobaculia bacterium]